MLARIALFAQARGDNSELNVWLHEHPQAFGGIILAASIGWILMGIHNVRSGITRNKLGMEFRGPTAQFSGYLRIIAGIGFAAFGLYKILAG